jgi:hypothetical protein
VLQSSTIFLNVSKGLIAGSSDLTAAFGTDDANAIAQLVCFLLLKIFYFLIVCFSYFGMVI